MNNRFGLHVSEDKPLEDSILWAADNNFRFIEFNADNSPNHIASFDAVRIKKVRALCETHNLAMGIHPVSAINNAEYVPIMSEAVDSYLDANLTLASRLGCGWLIGHGGYHFGDVPKRQQAAVERIKRLVAKAEQEEVVIFFENHNKEPEHAEIHYLPHNIEEMQWFFETIQSPHFKWAFNVAHTHLVPEDWRGFLDAFGVDNIGQVRLNDNKGEYEVHLIPGEGNIDFSDLFSRLKKLGYTGWFSLDFEGESDILRVRDWFETLI